MTRICQSLVASFLLLFNFVLPAQSDVQANPIIQGMIGEFFVSDNTISIMIKVIGDPGSITIVERPPEGWTITRTTHSAVLAEGNVTWNVTDFTGNLTVRYHLVPPADAAEDGIFTGTVDGMEITGQNVTLCPQSTPGKQVPMFTGLQYPYWLYLPEEYETSD